MGLDYHLVHTVIPDLPQSKLGSLGAFLDSQSPSSLFCSRGFTVKDQVSLGPTRKPGCHCNRPYHSRQATLHTAWYRMQVHPSHSLRKTTHLAPRKQGQAPHAIVGCLASLTPSTNPDWASAASTRNFIDVPLTDF